MKNEYSNIERCLKMYKKIQEEFDGCFKLLEENKIENYMKDYIYNVLDKNFIGIMYGDLSFEINKGKNIIDIGDNNRLYIKNEKKKRRVDNKDYFLKYSKELIEYFEKEESSKKVEMILKILNIIKDIKEEDLIKKFVCIEKIEDISIKFYIHSRNEFSINTWVMRLYNKQTFVEDCYKDTIVENNTHVYSSYYLEEYMKRSGKVGKTLFEFWKNMITKGELRKKVEEGIKGIKEDKERGKRVNGVVNRLEELINSEKLKSLLIKE